MNALKILEKARVSVANTDKQTWEFLWHAYNYLAKTGQMGPKNEMTVQLEKQDPRTPNAEFWAEYQEEGEI